MVLFPPTSKRRSMTPSPSPVAEEETPKRGWQVLNAALPSVGSKRVPRQGSFTPGPYGLRPQSAAQAAADLLNDPMPFEEAISPNSVWSGPGISPISATRPTTADPYSLKALKSPKSFQGFDILHNALKRSVQYLLPVLPPPPRAQRHGTGHLCAQNPDT